MHIRGLRGSGRGLHEAGGRLALVVALALATTLSSGCLNVPSGWIAFHSSRDGNVEIYKMLPDGSQQTRLTNNTTPDGGPEWSPDGQCIAYVTGQGLANSVWKMQADGSGQTPVTPGTQNMTGGISWAPYASGIAFDSNPTGGWDVSTIRVDGSQQKQLILSSTHEWEPAWSPDGQSIAVAYKAGGNTDIYKMHADGTQLTQLTTDVWMDEWPAWSWDGQWIAFTSNRDGDYEIFKIRSDGTQEMQLTYNNVPDSAPSWSPDGLWLAYESGWYGSSNIYTMGADGSAQTKRTSDGKSGHPSWGPSQTGSSPACSQPPDPSPTETASVAPSGMGVDLAITKEPVGQWGAGEKVGYEIVVTNVGDAIAQSPILVTDNLPPTVTYNDWSGSGWDCSLDATGHVVMCTYTGDLTPGQSADPLYIEVIASSAEPAGNGVQVYHPDDVVNQANNYAWVEPGETAPPGETGSPPATEPPRETESPTGTEPPRETELATVEPATEPPLSVDLIVRKGGTDGEFHYGQPAIYTISVGNLGSATSAGPITVVDSLSGAVSYSGFSGAGWSCAPAGQTVTCVYAGAIASGNQAPLLTIDVVVASATDWQNDVAPNCALLQHPNDINPANDESCVSPKIT